MAPYPRSARTVLTLVVGWLVGHAALARAQSPPPVVAAPVEVALGLTFNSLGTDVNAEPACVMRALPCTHAQPSRWGGVGLDVLGSGAVSAHLAVTLAATVSAYGWDARPTIATHIEATNVVRAGLVGLTLRSRFSHPLGPTGEEDRAFVQVLGGIEQDSLFGSHPVFDASAGLDSHSRVGVRGRQATVRLAVGYRASAGVGGLRFFLGVVVGPH
jgi:hypothetical protein